MWTPPFVFYMHMYFPLFLLLLLLLHLHKVWIYYLLITTKDNLTNIKCILLYMTWWNWKLRIISKYFFLCLVLRISLKFIRINEDLKGWAATAARGVQHLGMSRMCKSESKKPLFHLYNIGCLLSRDTSPEILTSVYCYMEMVLRRTVLKRQCQTEKLGSSRTGLLCLTYRCDSIAAPSNVLLGSYFWDLWQSVFTTPRSNSLLWY